MDDTLPVDPFLRGENSYIESTYRNSLMYSFM